MQILYNARIYTMDSRHSTATALVIDNGYIHAIGEQQSILAGFGETFKRTDLQGRTVIPGLTDAHIHLQHYALSLQKVDCETTTRDQCLQNVATRAVTSSPEEWILGHGWNQNEWQAGFGDAELLDHIAPSNPVYLTAKSLHAAWVNSVALKQAGITAQTPDPPGGRIDHREDGSPSGILFETAMSLVSDVIPISSTEKIAEVISLAQKKLWEMGLTAVHDFDRRTCFMALQQLHKSERLKLRVTKSLPIESRLSLYLSPRIWVCRPVLGMICCGLDLLKHLRMVPLDRAPRPCSNLMRANQITAACSCWTQKIFMSRECWRSIMVSVWRYMPLAIQPTMKSCKPLPS
jgi:predicted amidohydrolase YtcJ